MDPKAYQDILSLHAQANELLRHFWSCMPLTSEDRSNRAKRMVTALQDVITKIQNFKYNDGIYIGVSVREFTSFSSSSSFFSFVNDIDVHSVGVECEC